MKNRNKLHCMCCKIYIDLENILWRGVVLSTIYENMHLEGLEPSTFPL